jgi:large subunit ribosomal protein L32
MAVPKRKTSRSKRGSRRSHDSLKPVNCFFNAKSGTFELPHRVSSDGSYNNKQVVDVKKKEKPQKSS